MNFFNFKSDSSKVTLASDTVVGKVVDDHGPVTNEPIFTKPTKYEPILNPELDDSQKQKVKDLLAFADTIILDKNDPYYPHERGFLSEGTANRYMRARKWDLEAAKNMLEATVKWRREFRPDQLDPEYVRPEIATGKMYFNGFDKTGRPLCYMKPRFQVSKDSDRQVKIIIYTLEGGIRLMPDNIEKIAMAVDLQGTTSSSSTSLSTCKKFLEILNNHYPERLGVAFFINAPWYFLTTFKLIAPFMDPVTKSKIVFVNGEDSQNQNKGDIKLKDYIDADQTEVFLGGTHNFVFNADIYMERFLEQAGGYPFRAIEYK